MACDSPVPVSRSCPNGSKTPSEPTSRTQVPRPLRTTTRNPRSTNSRTDNKRRRLVRALRREADPVGTVRDWRP